MKIGADVDETLELWETTSQELKGHINNRSKRSFSLFTICIYHNIDGVIEKLLITITNKENGKSGVDSLTCSDKVINLCTDKVDHPIKTFFIVMDVVSSFGHAICLACSPISKQTCREWHFNEADYSKCLMNGKKSGLLKGTIRR